ncbi:MAG: hypothetical protein K2O72_08410, partial [Ligilactobacillus sp.]|nr:hypothetical protein [Ligilactobacillus sp.]
MSFLEKYSNIYVDLAQGTYIGKKRSKMLTQLDQNQTKEMMEKNYATFSFPHAKDAYGNDASKVYLQPDKLETVKE